MHQNVICEDWVCLKSQTLHNKNSVVGLSKHFLSFIFKTILSGIFFSVLGFVIIFTRLEDLFMRGMFNLFSRLRRKMNQSVCRHVFSGEFILPIIFLPLIDTVNNTWINNPDDMSLNPINLLLSQPTSAFHVLTVPFGLLQYWHHSKMNTKII